MGWQVYALTHDPLALGGLGLVEAIPALSLSLLGGHVADRRDRRVILRSTLAALTICAAGLAVVEATQSGTAQLVLLYVAVFIAGIARGFSEPAAGALEAQVVPRDMLIHSSTLMAGCWQSGAVFGPLVGGLSFAYLGPALTVLWIAVLYAAACVAIGGIGPKPAPPQPERQSVWESVAVGVRYVWNDQVLLGSMALDLFAVLFGGAIAILPIFAEEILNVGAVGLGALNAAPILGSLAIMLWSTRHPPVKHAGRNLFLAVTGFGVSMIVFALSKSFVLSMAMLFFSGLFDGLSVVIRRSILRLMSPDHLRGRIAAVSMIFIGSSNEIGALESGVAAKLLGTVRSVWAGGIATLVVVAGAAVLAPKLRRLNLDPHRAAECESEADEGLGVVETT
jgi:MFS family permease